MLYLHSEAGVLAEGRHHDPVVVPEVPPLNHVVRHPGPAIARRRLPRQLASVGRDLGHVQRSDGGGGDARDVQVAATLGRARHVGDADGVAPGHVGGDLAEEDDQELVEHGRLEPKMDR